MSDPIKIASLQLENVKRVKAVALTPTPNGLTILGGRNGQGKTSVLDSIAWALGGDKYRPSNPQRDESVLPPQINVTLSNGLIVERKGKNSALTVTDPQGRRYGQTLLNEFVNTFAIDLPRFLEASDKEKAETLLQIIGVGEQLRDLETRERDTYNQRHAIGQLADQKAKFAKEMPLHEGVPEAPISAGDLIRQQQDILLRNAENQRKRERRSYYSQLVQQLSSELEEVTQKLQDAQADLATAERDALDLHDESTAELEENILRIDEINRKVRANLDRQKAMEDAQQYADSYNSLTVQLENLRQAKRDLLNGANLPLPGLTVEDGKLLYKGHAWDGMSSSEQLIVGTAIARALKPECGFVLLDKLEQLDTITLDAFNVWLKEQGLQAIATRVSLGNECTVIIEDGTVDEPPASYQPKWKAGEF